MLRTRAYHRHQRARTKARHVRAYYELVRDGSPRKDIAKHHPRDCGGRCFLCHGDKLLGVPRLGEDLDWRSDQMAA
jgi:cytochrome c5